MSMLSPNEGWFMIILGLPLHPVLYLFYIRLGLLGKTVDFVQQNPRPSYQRQQPHLLLMRKFWNNFPCWPWVRVWPKKPHWNLECRILCLCMCGLSQLTTGLEHTGVCEPQSYHKSYRDPNPCGNWISLKVTTETMIKAIPSPMGPPGTIENPIQEPSGTPLIGHRFDQIAYQRPRHPYDAWSDATGPFCKWLEGTSGFEPWRWPSEISERALETAWHGSNTDLTCLLAWKKPPRQTGPHESSSSRVEGHKCFTCS